MYGRRAAARRFSLLLLEEEDDYVRDWVVVARWPDAVAGNWQRVAELHGRVRLCTRSMFFEPDDVRIPIARIPFASVQSIGQGPPVGGGNGSLVVTAGEVVLMRAGMREVPYTFLKAAGGRGGRAAAAGSSSAGSPSAPPSSSASPPPPATAFVWSFSPCYSPLQPLLTAAQELQAIHSRPREERNAGLEDLVRRHVDAASFDMSRLVDFSERVLWVGPATQLTPLVRERGHLAVTDARVYFQPLHNVSGDAPVKSHQLAAIAAVARRRSSLQPIGLELFFIHQHHQQHVDAHRYHHHHQHQHQGGHAGGLAATAGCALEASGPTWDAPSAFFAFRSHADREAVAQLLACQPELGRALPHTQRLGGLPGVSPEAALRLHGSLLEAAGPWLLRVTRAWQAATISNFDYLLYLNFAAGRSFNDLAQWPVFPWVLANYASERLDLEDEANFRDLSKPVGALNPVRLEEFRRRYRDMPADAFEGSVPPFMYGTHYSTPGYVMYWLVRAAPGHMLRLQNGRFDAPDRLFASIQESWSSVLSSSTDVKELIPEFFMDTHGGDFLINRLQLPLGVRQCGKPVDDVSLPPWAASPRDFLAKHRAALESPAVSRNLHHWIDLIFGYKQAGPAAEAADNIFYYLTYEGAADMAACRSPLELKALETQINEFGQCPKQLFRTPHPRRLVVPPAPDPATVFPEPLAAASPSGSAAGLPGSSGSGAGGGGSGYGGEGDAGNRDMALALLSTIIAAAAPEYATAVEAEAQQQLVPTGPATGNPSGSSATQATAVAPGLDAGEPVTRPSGSGASGPGSGAPSRAASAPPLGVPLGGSSFSRHSTPPLVADSGAATAGAGASGAVSPGQRSSASGVAAPSALAPVGASGGIAGVLSSFLKLGRYSQVPSQASSNGNLAAAASGSVTPSGLLSPTARVMSPPSLDGPALAASAPPAATSSSPPLQPNAADSQPLELYGSGRAPSGWGAALAARGRVRAVASAAVVKAPLCAVAASGPGPTAGAAGGSSCEYLYCAGQGGTLRVLARRDLSTLRSAQLEGDLLSLALLPAAAGACGSVTASGAAPLAALAHQPLVLAGSHNRRVLVYSPDAGRLVGTFDAHDDAVCCLALVEGAQADGAAPWLVTSSWDCSVKVWSLAEGRAPWATGLSFPLAELRDFESGVWALATPPVGAAGGPPLLATGTEEGVVAVWDLRAPGSGGRPGSAALHARVADDYVGGLALLARPPSVSGNTGLTHGSPGYLLAATADGALTLLDCRKAGGGHKLASASCGSPLRCCVADARLALAGDEGGALQQWDVGLAMGALGAARADEAPADDGLYAPWTGAEAGGGALSALCVVPAAAAERGGGSGQGVEVVAVTEAGRVVVLAGS